MATIAIKALRQTPRAWSGSAILAAAATVWHAYGQARRERRQLLAMNERELRDIGINRLEALREAQKPLWRYAFASGRHWIGGSP